MQIFLFLFLSWLVFEPGMPSSALDYENEEDIGRQIALSFIDTEGFQPTQEQLDIAKNIGINLIEVSDPVQIDNLSLNQFHILLGSEHRYLTVHQIETSVPDLIRSTTAHYRSMSDQYSNRIAAISLFYFPADFKESFYQLAATIADSLSSETDKPIYYQSAQSRISQLPESFSFKSARFGASESDIIPFPVVYFEPDENTVESLKALELLLNQSLQLQESIIILPADWFFERISHQPDVEVLLSSYLEGDEVLFPMPEADENIPSIHFGVIFLFLLWASFIVHYRYQPLFRGFVARYFFNHSFFVADIMEHRIRNLSSGITLLIQHGFIVGLFFYTFSNILFTNSGLSALSHHFPAIMIAGYEAESFFVIGIILAFLSHLVSVFWIYLLNKELKHLSQTVNLYSWILTTNLLIITILVYMEQQQVAVEWALVAGGLFLLIWFFSFNFAAIDASKYLTKYRTLNIFLTVGLHVLILISVFLFILFIPGFFETVELTLWLP